MTEGKSGCEVLALSDVIIPLRYNDTVTEGPFKAISKMKWLGESVTLVQEDFGKCFR